MTDVTVDRGSVWSPGMGRPALSGWTGSEAPQPAARLEALVWGGLPEVPLLAARGAPWGGPRDQGFLQRQGRGGLSSRSVSTAPGAGGQDLPSSPSSEEAVPQHRAITLRPGQGTEVTVLSSGGLRLLESCCLWRAGDSFTPEPRTNGVWGDTRWLSLSSARLPGFKARPRGRQGLRVPPMAA